MRVRYHGIAAAVAALLAMSGARAAAQLAPAATQGPARGLLRSEVSLMGHTLAISYAPDVTAGDEAANARAAPAAAAADRRTRVAEFSINGGTLRIGGIDLPKAEPPGRVYDVWLDDTDQGSTLRFVDRSNPDSAPIAVPIDRRSRPAAPPTFVAAMVPTAADSGQLVVSWRYDAAAPIKFVDPPVRPTRANSENGLPNVGVKRGNRDDTSAKSRAQFLSINSETAIGLPSGKRLVASFIRSISPDESGTENSRLRRVFGRGLLASGADYARLDSAANGAIVELTESQVPRLTIDTPVRFGNVTLRTENQVGGFPGVYGLWLKRVGAGWRLVFNNEYDVWGTQHDAKFDVADVELTHTDQQPATQPFTVSLIPTGSDRGQLAIVWGAHRWTADFIVPGR